MQNIKLILEFDGTEFAGWQIQPEQRTVQDEIEKALLQLCGESIRITGAGRTDSGVHALGMVANFKTTKRLPMSAYEKGLNTLLPSDIQIHSAECVPDSFDARRSAIKRVYRYCISKTEKAVGRQYAWHPRGAYDLELMKEASNALVGAYDFDAFSKYSKDVDDYSSEVFDVTWHDLDDEIRFEISAIRFFHNMIRIIMGTLMEVGFGKITVEQFKDILISKDRSLTGPTIPPHGLFLLRVEYA